MSKKERAITFKSIRRIQRENSIGIRELRAAQRETDRQMKQTEQEMKETDRRMKETDRQMKETEQEIKETGRQIRHLKVLVGGMSKNAGLSAEAYFQRALGKTLRFAGVTFDEMFSNLRKTRGGRNCEFDIVLVNHKDVGIVDAKYHVRADQPGLLATDTLKTFREFFPEYAAYNVYLGLAGFSIDKEAEEEARRYGVALLTREGDAVEALDIPVRAY